MMKKYGYFCLLLFVAVMLCACSAAENSEQPQQTAQISFEPDLPDTIRVDENGVPLLDVYVVEDEKIVSMGIESHLYGVLAGEMQNDWPLEALKAQAILARTFVIRFLSEKESKYPGADISTDVEEAQAYDAEGVNERIRAAVDETRGLIVCYQSEPIYAWFHSHAGGQTADAQEGLSYRDDAPYTQSVVSHESKEAPAEAQEWTASFTLDEVKTAAGECGIKIEGDIHSVLMGAAGKSGRIKTIRLNDQEVPANELRIALGSTKMRSTLLSSISLQDGSITMQGRGYGHGVGMSQWGAYAMAQTGKTAAEIIHYYFRDVDIVQKWR